MPRIPRLYTDADLIDGQDIELTKSQAHYLRNVLRRDRCDMIHLFNGRDGEWSGVILDFYKNGGKVSISRKMRSQTPTNDLWVLCAPIKKIRFDFCLEKTVELGASDFMPIYTEFTDIKRANIDRLTANAIEAAQQCDALNVITVHEPKTLDQSLDQFPKDRVLYVCAERGTAPAFIDALKNQTEEKAAILIGPEGGFSDDELAQLKNHDRVQFVHLGPLTLRTETALTASLSLYQAVQGSWVDYKRKDEAKS